MLSDKEEGLIHRVPAKRVEGQVISNEQAERYFNENEDTEICPICPQILYPVKDWIIGITNNDKICTRCFMRIW